MVVLSSKTHYSSLSPHTCPTVHRSTIEAKPFWLWGCREHALFSSCSQSLIFPVLVTPGCSTFPLAHLASLDTWSREGGIPQATSPEPLERPKWPTRLLVFQDVADLSNPPLPNVQCAAIDAETVSQPTTAACWIALGLSHTVNKTTQIPPIFGEGQPFFVACRTGPKQEGPPPDHR